MKIPIQVGRVFHALNNESLITIEIEILDCSRADLILKAAKKVKRTYSIKERSKNIETTNLELKLSKKYQLNS